jgi:hypothetical protein
MADSAEQLLSDVLAGTVDGFDIPPAMQATADRTYVAVG